MADIKHRIGIMGGTFDPVSYKMKKELKWSAERLPEILILNCR